jgi:hypothetical protein
MMEVEAAVGKVMADTRSAKGLLSLVVLRTLLTTTDTNHLARYG